MELTRRSSFFLVFPLFDFFLPLFSTLQEQGPRFDLKLYQIKLGTMEQTWAENEWVLRPFQNSAKKQKLAR